jgi:acetyl esterase/lipase
VLNRLLICALLAAPLASAQPRSAAAWAAGLGTEYSVSPNITYFVANNIELKLDVYTPDGLTAASPVVIYYHGGGWLGGHREGAVPRLLPYFEMGFSVVNVTYRGTRMALAPAAVEDCRCALLWTVRNAERYKFDTSKIILTGDSAGSHLALMSGMITAEAGLDNQCPNGVTEEPAVAAIVNWYGAADVADLLDGPNKQGFAVLWFGSQMNRAEIAKRVSPMTYLRRGLPAIVTIHGDADPTVPYRQAVRLHEELDKLKVVNQLVTVPGGRHGGFTREQMEKNFALVRTFLEKVKIKRRSGEDRPREKDGE